MINDEVNIMKIYNDYPDVVDILLHDNTTKKNIIWATNNYINRGLGCSLTDEIKVHHLIGKTRVIKPRNEKSKFDQLKRCKDNAEVFTKLALELAVRGK